MIFSCVLALVFVFLRTHVHTRIVDNEINNEWWIEDYDDDEDCGRGLFPSVFNLATNAIINANATCGETEQEIYCKLVEHVFMRQPQCGICDARSEVAEQRHPITNAIDGTNRWWQSPTLQNGKHYEWVTITLDLRQIFQIAYVIVKTAISPRPGNWILEHSRDGLFYKPWQYYALNDAECWEAYGVPPTVGQPRYRSDDEIICTSYYSKLNPLENAEIHTSLVNGRPGAEGPSDTLREFTTARYVRLRLQKIRTLNADLMTLQTDDPMKIDKSTTRRYFYSVKDISIGGQCVCFGHAKDCLLNQETTLLLCKCEHNTCGESCEQCCPLYQQRLWRPGTNTDAGACEKCQCFNHAEVCFYDQTVTDKKASLNIYGEYEGGGVCVHCKHHTTGINCEQCEDGYYRPLGVERDDLNPCRRCRCLGPGVTGFCVKDDSYILEGLYPGDCICKTGFAGSKCDHCASGFKHYPVCEPCPCNPDGTEGGTTCEGHCICKANVEGVGCDQCKPGHYDLDGQNPDGCSPCYCSGITNRCQPSKWGVKLISTLNGWMVSDFYGVHVALPSLRDGMLQILNDEMLGFDVYYWLAPDDYIQKKLYSYGGELRYVLSYAVIGDDDPGEQTNAPGVILEGDGLRIGHFFGSRQLQGNISVILPLQERVWSYVTAAGKRGRAVSRQAFARVFNNITRFLVRAKYRSDQVVGVLYNVDVEVANKDSKSLKKMSSVEKCICPLGYAGLSCEICESGYRRINNTLHNGVCEACWCNNHAGSCEPYTGHCQDCQHNTTGLFCDYCKLGFHGDPSKGRVDDCQPCACPLTNIENNFSPTCEDVLKSDGTIDYVCTSCARGYAGDKCEKCDSGYFGSPGVPSGYCQPCNCTYNENSSNPNYCNHITGQCLDCIGNTGGWRCDECLIGHYGNAFHHDCRPCGCSPIGSESSLCDPATGLCECKLQYVGRNCDRCMDGYGNVEFGCVPCRCNTTGSVMKHCDPVSGQCKCKAGIFGLRCDTCLEGYYSFSENGCKWCGCDVNGAASAQCNDSGVCKCKSNIIGKTCNQCVPGYWNLLSGQGCEDCKCDLFGSTGIDTCDELYGQCICRPGVTGLKCDQCIQGYYGLSKDGCKICEPCPTTGHICDPQFGDCVCPPYTNGSYCERCTHSAWGYDPYHGCKPCNCDFRGSPSDVCDVDNGNCVCLEGSEGRRCDKCRFGHFQFPICRSCDCRHDGSLGAQCTAEGRCQCDDNGQCPCKENVEGLKCDTCKIGTFGMTLENTKGCFECFCFKRAAKCSQARMVWSKLTMPTREVHFELGNTPLATFHNFLVIPGQTGHVKLGIPYILEKPLYWMLPRDFLGEKTKSYNGILQFQIESPTTRDSLEPLLNPIVLLQGNHRIVLFHSMHLRSYLPSSKGRYSVRLHEDEWRQLDNPQVRISRMLMMLALQNVQNILIRATDGIRVKIASGNILRISDVSMETAVALSPTPASPYVAVGIELCECQKEYAGPSCQDPGRGFYRKYKPNFLESPDLIDLIGYAAPCPCNNRSESCDPETGHCYNCRENTSGAFCEFCAKGYFGDPAMAPCQACACPLVTNSFSDTCEIAIKDATCTDCLPSYDHVCTNCLSGYEGKKCERCSRGYYGNPNITGNSCKPCECSPYGSLDRICDRMTGQCHCRRGISGRDCSQCQTRHILTESGCQSCEDNCTTSLLDDVDFLTYMAKRLNLTNFIPPPWMTLLTLENQTIHLQKSMLRYNDVLSMGLNITQNFTVQFDFETLVDFMYLRGRDINIKAGPLAFDAVETKEDGDVLLKDLKKIWNNICDAVERLQNQGNNLTFSVTAVQAKITAAEKMLQNVKDRDLSEQRQEVEREMRKASIILEDVKNTILDHPFFTHRSDQLKHINQLLSETVRLIERSVRRISVQSSQIAAEGKERKQNIKNLVHNSTVINSEIGTVLLSATDFLSEAEAYVINVSESLEGIIPLQASLENITEQLEQQRGIFARLNPRYIQKFVIPAKEHTEYISKQAWYLMSLFQSARNASSFPLRAVKIYDEIMDILDITEQVSIYTFNAADRAYYEVQPDREDSLTKQALFIKHQSEDLREEAIENMLDSQAMQENVRKKQTLLHEISTDITNGNSTIEAINAAFDLLSHDIGDKLHDIEEEHTDTKIKMNAVHENVDQMIHMMNNILFPQLDHLKVGSTAGLYQTKKMIDSAKQTTNAAIRKADVTERRVQKVKWLNGEMQLSLKNLKNKILLARQKASNIRVSLSSDRAGICVRSFQPDIEPTTTTNIVLNYAISSDEKDSLLFFLANSKAVTRDNEPEDFMIVEMVNRKIRFLWNAGGGTQVIQHNLTISSNDEQLLNNALWYKIEVKRFGNVATLSVLPTPDGHKPDPHQVTDSSPAGYGIMDLDSTSFFYIGGTPKGFRVPRELKARNFAGCLYEINLDGKKIGLWNFMSNQGCTGCKEGAAEDADFTSYSFRGDGYAILPQIKRYKKGSYLVTLRFKTFDENAMIFFAPNTENGDFVSLELQNGHVVYQYSLGSQTRFMLKTKNTYNNGNWTRLAASREKLQGQLSVGDELLEGQLPIGSPTKMELQQIVMYFSGVPPNFTNSVWNGITFQNFLGCMKDLQIDSTPLDLLKNGFFGVDPGCKDTPIRIVSFLGDGYLELESHRLLEESTFGFTFESNQDSAVLLLSTFAAGKSKEDKKDYYSVAIINGYLEAIFYGGHGKANVTSLMTVNDGNYHTVVFLKRHRKIIMRIDDQAAGETRLPKGTKDIDAPVTRGLFLGGIRDYLVPQPMISTNEYLIGTIKDVVFDNRLLHLNKPASFKRAGIGRSKKQLYDIETPYTGVTQPLERCSEMASYASEKRGRHFGDEQYSHIQMKIGRKDFVHDFNVTFDFRTAYPNGLLVLVKNGRSISHFAIMLVKAHVVIDVYDRKTRHVTAMEPVSYDDWHSVTVTKVGRIMTLRIDNKKAATLKVRRRISLRSPLYAGGAPSEIGTVNNVILESFKGCIRNLHLNKKYLNFTEGELFNVSECFTTIERGAYFPNDSYAIYDTKFDLGVKLDIQLEFKTTQYDGVLLSLSGKSGYPALGLELYNGSVVITVALNRNEKPFSAIQTFQSKYDMCDGRWHTVTAQYAHKTVTLKVDMFDVSYGLSENIPLEPRTSEPLYIGGIPDDTETAALNLRYTFFGCMKNLAINDRRVDWIDMAARYNVLPNSCPTF